MVILNSDLEQKRINMKTKHKIRHIFEAPYDYIVLNIPATILILDSYLSKQNP